MIAATGEPIAISVVIPVYRSAPILPKLVEAIERTMSANRPADLYEMVLVNDASPDDSWAVIRKLARTYPGIRGICLRKNAGQHNATMAGLRHATGRSVVIMDDDLQHPPEAITRMVAELDRGYDVCYTRYIDRKHPLWKRLGSHFNDWIATLLLNKPKGLYLSSFKAMRSDVAREIVKYDGPYAYVDGLILDVTRTLTSIDIEHGERYIGEGNYNLVRSISLWLKMATSFSVLPLRMVTFTGFLLATLSGAAIVAVLITKLLYPQTSAGWSSLLATILFVGGAQLMGMGIIGEYLGRAYLRLNGKPQYVIRETTTRADSGQNEFANA
jgi:glycosyltransferase involved in cell wall biosynthesis